MRQFRRLLALLAVAAIASGSVVALPAAAAATDPRAEWVEAESAALSGGFAQASDAKASDAKYAKLDSTSAGAGGTVTSSVTASAAGAYDVWILSTPPDRNWASQLTWRVNAGAEQPATATVRGADVYRTSDSRNVPINWNRIGSADLQSGSNSLTISATTARQLDGTLTIAYVDTIAVVPAAWNWEPSGFSRPFDVGYGWVEGESGQLQGGYQSRTLAGASASGIAVLDASSLSSPASATYNLNVGSTRDYDLWVLGTPGNVNWASPMTWTLDGTTTPFQPDITSEPVYNTSDSRQVPIIWQRLDRVSLTGGSHDLTLTATGVRTLSGAPLAINYIDAVALVPSEWGLKLDGISRPYDPATLKVSLLSASTDRTQVAPGEKVTITAQISPQEVTSASVQVVANVLWRGQVVASGVSAPVSLRGKAPGSSSPTTVSVTLPADAPSADATVSLDLAYGHFVSGADQPIGDLRIGYGDSPPAQAREITFSELGVPGSVTAGAGLAIEGKVNPAVDFTGEVRPYVVFRNGDEIAAVAEATAPIEVAWSAGALAEFEATLDVPTEIKNGNYTATVGMHTFSTAAGGNVQVTVTGSQADESIRPLSAGFSADSNGATHFWYVDQRNAMVWDGEPFIPIGGMLVSKYITSYNPATPTQNEENWNYDVGILQQMHDKGMTDLYINAVINGATRVPAWAWQRLIDKMDELGLRYGLQLNGYTSRSMTLDVMAANGAGFGALTAQGVDGHGVASVIYDKAQAFPGTDRVVSATYVAINPTSGELAASGNASVAANGNGKWTLTAPLDLDGVEYDVTFTPRIVGGSGTMANFWDDQTGSTQAIKTLTAALRFGPGFRLFIDPNINEAGIVNRDEPTRPVSPVFDTAYGEWLAGKYDSLSALSESWKLGGPVSDWEAAARLVPQRTAASGNGQTIIVRDHAGTDVLVADPGSRLWDDFLEFRAHLYTRHLNATANTLKEAVDAPVVYKYTGAYKPYFEQSDSRAGHGFDGLGGEIYGEGEEAVRARVSYSYSAARSSSRTVWLITTETQLEENIQVKADSGIVGYPDKATMFEHLDANLAGGEKGIYDFVFNAPNQAQLHAYYSYTAKPEQYDWLREFRETRVEGREDEFIAYEPDDIYYSYPAGQMWWQSPNQRTSVLAGDDYDGAGTLVTTDTKYLVPTGNVDVGESVLVVSLQDDPATSVWGEPLQDLDTLLERGTQLVVMGHRDNLGALPELDAYFTDEFLTLADGSQVQVLSAPSGAQVLHETDGKVWGLRDGNLWIITDDTWHDIYEADYLDELGFFTDFQRSSDGELATLTIGGQAVDGFEPSRTQYVYDVRGDASGVPLVEAAAAGEGETVEVEQAESLADGAFVIVKAADGRTLSTITVTFRVVAVVPLVPEAPSAERASDTSITVRWEKPGSDGASPIVAYRVYQDGSEKPLLEVEGASLSATVAGLALGSSHRYQVTAVNAVGESARSTTTGVITLPEVPSADGAKGAPGAAVLSSDEGWDTGLSDGIFDVKMNLWWGENGSLFKLYRDGHLVTSRTLPIATPTAQTASVRIAGLPNGDYTFTGVLVNSRGATATAAITVSVRNALPGKPVLSRSSIDTDGSFTLTADMWWGTNANRYRFFEGEQMISEGSLTPATPEAQKATVPVNGGASGAKTYRVEFINDMGSTDSDALRVTVNEKSAGRVMLRYHAPRALVRSGVQMLPIHI